MPCSLTNQNHFVCKVSLEYTEFTFIIKKEVSLARGKNKPNHSCAVAEVQFT